jgi:hypothetical protein
MDLEPVQGDPFQSSDLQSVPKDVTGSVTLQPKETYAPGFAEKAGEWSAWLAANRGLFGPAMTQAADPVAWTSTLIGQHELGHSIVNEVKKQVKNGKDINNVEFPSGSPGDLFGLISYLKGKTQPELK